MLILGVMLPGLSRWLILLSPRARELTMTVLFLTARDGVQEWGEGVGAGRLLEALSYHHDLRTLVKNPQGGIVFQSSVFGTEMTSDAVEQCACCGHAH